MPAIEPMEYSPDFQRKIVAMMYQEHAFLRNCVDKIKPEDVARTGGAPEEE